MKPKEKRQQELKAQEVLVGFLGEAYREADFCYYRGQKAVFVTYEDFKPEEEVKQKLCELLGSEWKVVVKRVYSDLTIMLTMLKLYKENRVAIVDEEDGELRPYTIRAYVYKRMAEN